MPDNVRITPATGKIEFFNNQSPEEEIGSLEPIENDSSSDGKDEVEALGIKMDGGTYTAA